MADDEPCPFCRIAAAYPASVTSHEASATGVLRQAVPANPDAEKVQPNCFLVLNTKDVMAFLDILPMTRGHVLLATREHRPKLADVGAEEGRGVGFWLPLLAKAVTKVTGVEDYNIVQNNGIRAAQVVPHVHFHIIPRPAKMPELKNKSWTMFGRGQRDDLDEEEAEVLAREIREELKTVIEESGIKSKAML